MRNVWNKKLKQTRGVLLLKDGKVKMLESVTMAAHHLSVSRAIIHAALRGDRDHVDGYEVKYA